MDLDELKSRWEEMDRKLDASMKLNQRLVRQSLVGRAMSALKWLTPGIAVELAINTILLVILGGFIAAHISEPRFLFPALALHLFAIAHLAGGLHQLVAIWGVSFDEPVLEIQRRLAELRILRIRVTKWTLIIAPLLWPLMLIVGMKMLHVDAYRVLPGPWLAGNFVFGVAFVVVMLALAPRLRKMRIMQRVMDDLAGRSLANATRFLKDVKEFERA